ncbi:MAG TPA: hypothetical protein VGB79_15310 [Allosphingosinicella sp.]|jgi:hypothetical protein
MSAAGALQGPVAADILQNMRRTALIILLALGACRGPAAESDAQLRDGSSGGGLAASTRPRSLLAPPLRRTSPVTRQWLVGYWAYNGQCEDDSETALWPDGTYTMGQGGGRWSLVGSTLKMRLERLPGEEFMQVRLGDDGSSEIRKTGSDEMQVEWGGGLKAGGAGARFVRCD